MELTKFVESFDDGRDAPQNGRWAPKHFFYGAMIGPSGSGKTHTLLQMIFGDDPETKIYFDNIMIFARNTEEPAYKALKAVLDRTEDTLRDAFAEMGDPKPHDWKLYTMSDTLKDVPDVNKMNVNECKLMIFDDFARDKEQGIIEQHYKMGRKKKCSYFYLSQSYYDIPQFVRKNLTHLFIWKLRNMRDIRNVIGEHSVGFDTKELIKIYQAAVEPKYSFMIIDKLNPDLPIRQGFRNIPKFG